MIKNFFKKYPWLLWMIIIAAVTAQVILFKYRELLHVDELFSFGMANGDNGVFLRYRAEDIDNHIFSGEDFKNYLIQRDGSFLTMWHNLRFDTHMPLYFVLMRLFYSLAMSTEFTLLPAFLLNVLIFVGLLIGAFGLFKTLFKDEKIALLAVLILAFCKPILSMAVFLRMYLLWCMLVIFLLDYSCQYLMGISKSIKTCVCIFLFSMLQLLTHFYGFIFGGMLLGGGCLVLFLDKRYRDMLIFAGIILVSFVVSYLIFPEMLEIGVYGERGVQFWARLSDFFNQPMSFFRDTLFLFFNTVFGNWIVAVVAFILSGLILFSHRLSVPQNRIFCMLSVVFWGYGVCSALVQPPYMGVWQIRYFSPTVVICVCLSVYLLYYIESFKIVSKFKKNFVCCMLLILAYLNALYVTLWENPFWVKEVSVYPNNAYTRLCNSVKGADVWWGIGGGWSLVWQLHIFADKLMQADKVFVLSDFENPEFFEFAKQEQLQGKYAYLLLPFTQEQSPEGAVSWVKEHTGRQSFYLFTFKDDKYASFLSAAVLLVAPY